MSNRYFLTERPHKKTRHFLFLGAAALGLVSCTPQADCALINGALADSNLQVQAIYEGNRGGSGFNQAVERQVGRVHFDTSQVLDGLTLENRTLQTVQFELVEAYQQASDVNYAVAELLAANSTLDDKLKADIRQMQLESEANIGTTTEKLRKTCPLR